ncbi:MAG: NAD(P)-binding domain-containing protein [Rhodopirellula sp.]|nr:NAD(P)-binding domain-containing protein [Rhodopirellula sp.]
MGQDSSTIEVAIIGAGPIGVELGVAFERLGVACVVFDGGQLGETIRRWPPNTHFFSSPERIAVAGIPIPNLDQTKISGEAYLAYLRSVVEQFDLNLRLYEKVERIDRRDEMFELETNALAGRKSYRCRHVVLATGGMAAPRFLGVPGENLPHVRHIAPDPHTYFRTRLLIVGGRNSAVEAALRCWRVGAKVTVCYRRPEFDREIVKPHLFAEVGMLIRQGQIGFLPERTPVEITPRDVVLAPTSNGEPIDRPLLREPADFVLVCSGFVADMSLFEMAGVELRGQRRIPAWNPETMETNVPGLYVAGTAAGGTQQRFEFFIETCHVHVDKIVAAITGRTAGPTGLGDSRRYTIPRENAES